MPWRRRAGRATYPARLVHDRGQPEDAEEQVPGVRLHGGREGRAWEMRGPASAIYTAPRELRPLLTAVPTINKAVPPGMPGPFFSAMSLKVHGVKPGTHAFFMQHAGSATVMGLAARALDALCESLTAQLLRRRGRVSQPPTSRSRLGSALAPAGGAPA